MSKAIIPSRLNKLLLEEYSDDKDANWPLHHHPGKGCTLRAGLGMSLCRLAGGFCLTEHTSINPFSRAVLDSCSAGEHHTHNGAAKGCSPEGHSKEPGSASPAPPPAPAQSKVALKPSLQTVPSPQVTHSEPRALRASTLSGHH